MVWKTLLSAILLPLALPNEIFLWGAFLLGLIALVPAFIAVYQCKHWKDAARLGVLFGAVSTALGSYWLAFFGEFAVWTIGGPIVGYMGYNYILFGFLHFTIHHKSSWYRPLRVAVLWTGYEYFKSVGFLGYPWGLIAYPLSNWYALAQSAELFGVWGLSFLGAYINAGIAEYFISRESSIRTSVERIFPGPHALAALLLVLISAGFGYYQLQRITVEEEFDLLVVQQNIDSWAPGAFSDALQRAQDLTIRGLEEARSAGRSPEMVVWSETSIRRPYDQYDPFFASAPRSLPFHEFMQRIDLPLVTGAAMFVPGTERDLTNSALVIAPTGELLDSYAKQQLVPMAESIPGWEVPLIRKFFEEVVGLYGTWIPGNESNPLQIPRLDGTVLTAGAPICFEDAFGWVSREKALQGARVMVNLTNNSWSLQVSAQTQHLVAARLRGIELRMPLVRGTNSGVTGVVDATGFLRHELPMFIGTSAVVSVPLYSPQWTLYRAIGDSGGLLAAVGSLLWIVGAAGSELPGRAKKRRALGPS
jgi:apolipoprotein N-acyltransferase